MTLKRSALFSGELYQGAPIYVHASSGWSLYRRANGQWHLDFNEVSEDWSGTVYTRGDKFIYYRSATDKWYVYDQLGSSSAWFISDVGCDSAWSCDGYSTGEYEVALLHGGIVSSTSVALRTKFGTYIKVNDQGDIFSANSTSTGTRKTFDLIELSTGYTLLRAHNGNFVCESGGALEATRSQADEDCYFTAFYIDDKVAFMAPSGDYIDADGIKNVFITDIDVRADQTSIGNHEQFTIVNM